MTDPVVFRRTLPILVLAALRLGVPPLVAVACLRVSAYYHQAEFDTSYSILAVLVAILTAVFLQPNRDAPTRLAPRRAAASTQVVLRWLIVLAVLLLIAYITKTSADFSRSVILTWALATPVMLVVAVLIMEEMLRNVILSTSKARAVVVAGYNETSRLLAERLAANPELRMKVTGFFDDRSAERLGLADGEQLLGGLQDLAGYVKAQGIDMIFIALPMRHIQRVLALLDDLRDTTSSIYYIPDIFVFDLIQSRTIDIMGMPAVAMCETPFYGLRGAIKRLSDVIMTSLGLLALLPLMCVIAIAVKLSSPGPALFRQRRYGLDGQEILVFKFRTMTVTEDGANIRQATRHDARITPTGRFLRRTSLDELPQLINVLRGEMSLVGPRPHAVAHNEQYRRLIKGYMMRHKVSPGITGLAQVNGCRGETARLEDMQARVNYDLEYLRHWSPLLDLKILWLTVVQLLRDKKAY